MSTEEPASGGDVDEAPAKVSRRGVWWLVGGGALLVVALMLGSAAGGWWLANRAIAVSTSNAIDEPEVVDALSAEPSMPDVRGLTRDEAAQVLADSGFPASIVTFEDTPSGAPAGVVVVQSPVFGTASPGEITLGIAVPTTMPSVVGMHRDAAVAALSDLGVAVAVELQYSPGTAIGTILGSSPVAGEPLGDAATIILAIPGVSATLDQIERLSGNCRRAGKVSLGGEEFASSVQCPTDTDSQTTVWMLRAKADRFTAVLGIDDTAVPGSTATVELLADGNVVASERVAFGKPIEVDIPVTGVLQVAVRTSSPTELNLVLGGAAVHGADAKIAELVR